MSPFRPLVSASKISVPDSNVRDRFDDWVGSWQFDPFCLHHPVPPNCRFPGRLKTGRFCGDFRGYRFAPSVSGDPCGLSGRFLTSRLCIQKFRSPRQGFDGQCRSATGIFLSLGGQKRVVSRPARSYRGLNPSASNCWLHSAGASRSRSTPTPRGNRPSTAARTRSGARNAGEIVMLT